MTFQTKKQQSQARYIADNMGKGMCVVGIAIWCYSLSSIYGNPFNQPTTVECRYRGVNTVVCTKG